MNTRTVGTAGAFAGWHALVLWMAVAPAIALGGPVQPAGPAAADRRLAAPFSFQPDKPRGRGPIIHPSMVRRLQLIGGGRPVKAWVFFTDKGVASPEEYNRAIQETAAACHPRMLRRRALRRSRPGLLDRQDLPVVPRYVRAVEAGGARVHVVSRWLNGVSVRADQRQLAAIARLAFVRSIEPVRRARRVEPIAVPPASRGGQGSTTGSKGGFYGLSVDQLTQINLIAVHNQGFTGDGVVIGLLDTGFDRIHASFNDPLHPVRVVAERDFVDGDDVTSAQPGDPPGHTSHGTRVLSVIGAFWPGTLVGGAYDASFVLCKTEDTTSETPIEEDNFVAGLEFIEANGGDTATASLGYSAFYTQADMDGRTAVTTLGVNVATANGLHCVNSAGNGGHDGDPATSSISPPADAFQVISVGAVTADGTTAGFSSDGPTADGRIKPEVLARGVLTQTAFGTTGVSGANGTSFSAPLLASAVGCLVQAHPDWTVDQMRTYLFQTADRYASTETTDPTFVRGYGIIDTLAALGGDCNGNGVDDAVDIANGTAPDCDGNGVPDSCLITDCNGNGVPDRCDIAADPSSDLDGNGIPDVCCVPPAPAPSGQVAAMNRYIVFSSPLVGEAQAVRVRFVDLPPPFDVFNGQSLWVGPPSQVSESPAQVGAAPGIPTFTAATLRCDPTFMDWGAVGPVHVFHERIVPGGVYALEAAKQGCGQGSFSAPLTVAMGRWGDLVGPFDSQAGGWTAPDGSVDVTVDVIAVVDKFRGLRSAPPKVIVDVEPGTPDRIITIADAVRTLDAFQGKPYPFDSVLPPCP